MAANEVTKKLLIYHILYRLNVSFSNIVVCCTGLQGVGVFNRKDVRVHKGLAQELQSEINQLVLERMHSLELDDWGRFGEIRLAEEKRLRDPDDVFICAEERRRKIQSEKKKKRTK